MGLQDGSAHLQDGLVFKEEAAFGQGVHLTGEADLLEVIEKRSLKQAGAGKKGQVVCGEPEGLQVFQGLGQAGGDEIAPVRRVFADKEAEGGFVRHPLIEITGRHGQLIKISQQGQALSQGLLHDLPAAGVDPPGLSSLKVKISVHYN